VLFRLAQAAGMAVLPGLAVPITAARVAAVRQVIAVMVEPAEIMREVEPLVLAAAAAVVALVPIAEMETAAQVVEALAFLVLEQAGLEALLIMRD